MVTFGERLREQRINLGFSQTDFGVIAGVTKKTQMLYEADDRVPDARYLTAVGEAGADLLFILTGERSVSVPLTPELPTDEQLLLDSYRTLCTAKKKDMLASLLIGKVSEASP